MKGNETESLDPNSWLAQLGFTMIGPVFCWFYFVYQGLTVYRPNSNTPIDFGLIVSLATVSKLRYSWQYPLALLFLATTYAIAGPGGADLDRSLCWDLPKALLPIGYWAFITYKRSKAAPTTA